MTIFKRDKTFTQPIIWITTLFMAGFHIAAIAALFFFTWKGLALAVTLWWVAGSLGIGMGYHRLLTHRGYKTPKWVEYFLTVCGTLALEGGPIAWVATHRVHHQNTDKEGYLALAPRRGHLGPHGLDLDRQGPAQQSGRTSALCFRSSQRQVPPLDQQVALGSHGCPGGVDFCYRRLVLPALGSFFSRTVFGLHSTWLVNSATHMWGSQRFLTGDTSTNSFWVAMLTFGEGWHNNHHAAPQSARHGITWYELDVNWYGISALRILGLAWDIKLPKLNPSKKAQARIPIEVDKAIAPLPTASGD